MKLRDYLDHTQFHIPTRSRSTIHKATAVILLAGPAHGAGLCDKAPNKAVCNSIVYNRTDPREAVVAFIHKLVNQTKVGKVVAQKQAKSYEIVKCITEFDRSIEFAKGALKGLDNGDLATLKNYITAAQNNYLVCVEAFRANGKTNPIAKTNFILFLNV
nr:hypothetical protein CFP56_01626 [Quercus suber]